MLVLAVSGLVNNQTLLSAEGTKQQYIEENIFKPLSHLAYTHFSWEGHNEARCYKT